MSYFLPSYPTNSPKNQNLKKWKKCLEISSYTSIPKIMIMWCTVPEVWCAAVRWTDKWTDGWMGKVKRVPHPKNWTYHWWKYCNVILAGNYWLNYEHLFRSSHQSCSIKKGYLKNFARFTVNHKCKCFLIKLQDCWNPFYEKHDYI